MPNERGKSVDTTHLPLDLAEDRFIIHRDYMAHCMRWSHACKVAMKMRDDLWVLDIGCGRDMPMAKMLYTNKIGAHKYCGVDFSHFDVPEMLNGNGVFPVRLLRNADAAKITEEKVSFKPNLVVCFEMFEHVEPRHGRAILKNAIDIMRDDGVFLFSTPCFDGKAAGNHVAEPEYEMMGATLEDLGFAIEAHWGTFASMKDYRDELWRQYGQQGLDLFDGLRDYYDVNFLAIVFAPLFPNRARNCLWRCVKLDHYREIYGGDYVRQFPRRIDVRPLYSPTGSSSLDDNILDWPMYDRMFPGDPFGLKREEADPVTINTPKEGGHTDDDTPRDDNPVDRWHDDGGAPGDRG